MSVGKGNSLSPDACALIPGSDKPSKTNHPSSGKPPLRVPLRAISAGDGWENQGEPCRP